MLEMYHITMVHNANFVRKQLGALELLNTLVEYRLHSIIPNLRASFGMLLTAPVTAASIERKLSKLKLITNYLRSTAIRIRYNNVARISI